MSDTFKWVMCGYDRWYLVVYNDPKSFAGWHAHHGHAAFCATKDLMNKFPQAISYDVLNPLIINKEIEKNQWENFGAKQRKELPKQMIIQIFLNKKPVLG